MARLIPRKQIEEQQNISGSLSIKQDVNIGNNAIVSGSLLVSQSFFLGTNTGSKSEITGSVFLTGSLTIDGAFQTTNPSAIFSVTASNSLIALDTQRYEGIRARDFGANVPTLYVSSTDGNDANDGRSIQFPLRTIKRACQLATPGYDGRYGLTSSSLYNGYVIRVQAGTYLEDNPVIMPKNSTIWGSGLRITKILAANKGEDLFWVNSGCYVAEVTVGGLQLYPNQVNPEKGFGFAFQPGAFITTSPYIQNCSQISNQENSFAELYEDIPPGGGGLYVNGDVINPDSPLASMVLDAYTQISPNGVGCLVNGRGFIQLVSFFNNFSYYAIRVNNGGHATLNNSNISFGLYGMYASGSRLISGSGGDLDSRNSVRSTWSSIVDVLHKGYPEGLPTASILNTNAGIKVTSEPQFFLAADHTASLTDADTVNANFTLVSEIITNGNSEFPTLLAKSSNKGYNVTSPYNILGGTQITSSISASNSELNQLSSSFGTILGIFANGTGSYIYKSNTTDNIKVTDITPITSVIPATNYITSSVSSSFETIINIVKNGLSSIPKVVSNASSSILISDEIQFTTGESSSLATVNLVSSSFSIVYNIIANGTGSSILDIPENEQVEFTIKNTNSSSFSFDGLGNNPTITLFRGNTYKFYVNAKDEKGPLNYPFWIRTKPVSGIEDTYDYNIGVVNNGDSVGNITFTVPYNAPNTLYYVAENSDSMVGVLNIVNATTTPIDLIESTLTYPKLVQSSSLPSENVDKINAYDQLVNNIPLIQAETIAFVSSSWTSVSYDQTKCARDVAYIVNGVAKDLLYGGNEESIRSGLYYYTYPSQATIGAEKTATLAAVKYATELSLNLVKNVTLQNPNSEKESVAQCIKDNREFIQTETIAYLSSSWSGGDGFYYNEAKCKRDVGYILDAVATDLKYGGNERSVEAARYYYLYPSAATVAGVPSSAKQLEPTLNGVRYAAGVVLNLIQNKTFNTPTTNTQATVDLLRANKELIQNETIQYIGVAYPQLTYNTSKCRRDVGYIIDAVATDILYGGNERSVTAGKNYYNYPSIATSTQKKETSGAIRYTKIISDYVVQNIVLDTPRIVNNDEKGIKVTAYNNITSSFSGTQTEYSLISSSFGIMEGIIKKGVNSIPAVLAKNTNQNWSINNPLNVTTLKQITSSYQTPIEVEILGEEFDVVTSIIANGGVEPTLIKSQANGIKVTDVAQTFGILVSGSVLTELSASIGQVGTIISNGTSSLQTIVKNTLNNIKVTPISLVSGTPATGIESSFISSSIGTIIDIITNGLDVLPTLVQNTNNNIKVSGVSQTTISGSLEDVNFISQSISIVTQIIETGNTELFNKQSYISPANSTLVYNTLKDNIPFIQAETIAYLSSSWAGFQYDENKCKRDVGLIISGAAEDFLFNANSASVVSGQFYYEFPSQATDNQLDQTLDGINYASRLAQKIIQNVTFVNAPTDNQNAASLIVDNKEFIQAETIAYMSSSWSGFDYNEAKCRRDIGYIIDNVATDLIYGGNERTRQAGIYYYKYPSQANGSQLIQTTDAVNYASTLLQKIVVGETFTHAESNKLNASNLIFANKKLIAEEVVAYVSSSWSEVVYNEEKCKRDVGYILDAIRTDLVYGGNERTNKAGEFYYLYPSRATVGGVPSEANQLDPTLTGVYYSNQLVQNIVQNVKLIKPSIATLKAAELVRENRSFIQNNTIQYIGENYPTLNYNTSKCRRDVGFIVDGAVTDLVYGGNERSIQSGRFYYRFPNKATDVQLTETIDSINFAKNLTKLVAIGGREIENGFDSVVSIIESGSIGYPTKISNTEAGIKATNTKQYTLNNSANTSDKELVSASFSNVINIIANGTGSIPTIVSASFKGVNVIGGSQITSSLEADKTERGKVNDEFDIVLSVVENGLSSIPEIISNTIDLVKITEYNQTTGSVISNSIINSTTSSFDIVLDIIENGTGSMVTLINNANALVKVTDGSQWTTVTNASSKAGIVTSSIDTIINIITNGLDVIPTLIENTNLNIIVSNVAPTYGISATIDESNYVSSLFDLGTNIIINGTGSIETLSAYTIPSTDPNVINAYNNLKANISFIAEETISYLSSSWSTASYDETKCRRDVGYFVSGAAEDLLFNSYSASIMNGYYYFLYPSQATTTQLDQTLDGINYAKRLAEKVVLSETFTTASNESIAAKNLLINNKTLIANEVIAYISSSWTIGDNTSDPYFYNEVKCKRDVGYILDAVATDIVYGGNERQIQAGFYYYKYPSQATGYQLDQTIDGVRYAKNLAFEIINGNILSAISQEKLDARTLIDNNRKFISEEVVAYVSSSWRDFDYNESKCKRDVGYILDAVKTDLVYGGNERSRQAGEYYYRYPSQATGAELAPTLTGVRYAKNVLVEVLKGNQFSTPTTSKQIAYDLLVENKDWIQTQTIANINSQLTTFDYNEAKCRRDVGYILDAVATDILYGGNERATEAGRYYFLFPSVATGSQLTQTLDGIAYAKDISHKIVSNEIVYTQITSSITPNGKDQNKVETGFDTIIDVIINGVNSLPNLFSNTSSSIKVTDSIQYSTTASILSTYISSSNNGFDIVADIIENTTGSILLVKNTNGLVKFTNTPQYSSSIAVSGSKLNFVKNTFNTIIDIIQYGTGSIPTVNSNVSNIKVTDVAQILGTAATISESVSISASISIVTDIIENGIVPLPTLIPYVSTSTDPNVINAYNNLKANIPFIQAETIVYLSSSWSSFSYNEEKCKRDVGLIISGAAEDLLWNSNSASIQSGYYYFLIPSQATSTQLDQTLDGINYASKLAQKVVLNNLFELPTEQSIEAYKLLVNNKSLIANEVIAYVSSSWSNKQYNEVTCKRDVGYIVDAVATDLLYSGNERSVKAGYFYYKYPSQATNVQIDETITGVEYARDLSYKLVSGGVLQLPSQNKLQAKELILNNKQFIQKETIAFISASWSNFEYNEASCSRDVAYILDAVATDIVYGGNERSIQAGDFYYKYPSTATTAQLYPTLTGVRYAKGLTEQILKNTKFVSPSASSISAFNLLMDNREFIQNETMGYLNSAWSFYKYNKAKCRRDVGYMIDAVATDILYGGNERVREAGYFYYKYPSLATVNGNGQSIGELGQTLDGVRYAKGLAKHIVSNTLLQNPTQSEVAGFNLLTKNKPLIQNEVIAYISSSWSGIGSFSYNEASCSRDVAYIIDNVATDLLYGGNERSSKAGEYYYLYPSKAILIGSISPTTDTQKGPTIDGVTFAAGMAQKVISNSVLTNPTAYVISQYNLLKENRTFIQDETIQYIDFTFPTLVYNRTKCRRDVGYIVDNVSTDMFYGGNERGITAGDYYYRYPNLATTNKQVVETVAGIEYAKEVSKRVAQNILLVTPSITSNTSGNIKATDTNQYTSSISVSTTEISKISSSFSIVTDIIGGGVQSSPTKVLNTEAGIKVSGLTPTTSSINGSDAYADLVTSSFNLVRDIIYYGENGTPDALARNYDYGFELSTPTLLHISSTNQQDVGTVTYTTDYTPLVSSSYATIIDIVNNGTGSIPSIIENTSSSIYFGSAPLQATLVGTTSDINKIASGFENVMSIIEGTYPSLVPNTYNGIKVTDTPQLISGSASERLQAKLISSSFALVIDIITNGTGSQPFISSSATINTNPKVQSAYHLLLDNKQMIIDETIAYMSSSWSTFEYTQSKCERDLAYIIDGAAFDLIHNGNSASFVNGKYYYDIPSQATDVQLDQTITALKYASGISEKVVKNIPLIHISASQETSASYSSLLTNKEFIKGEVIQYINLSWSSPNFIYDQNKCSRDVGYIIDAVATDLLYGGNERSIVAGDYYYRYPSQATTSELQPTLDGINYAKGLAMNVVNNTAFTQFGIDMDLATSAEVLYDNKTFIQDETIAFVNSKYPYLYYDQTKCRRDVGYIVDAVLTDLIYGGNQRAATAGEFYFKYPSIATNTQLVETTAAIDYARRLSEEVIKGNLIPTPQPISNTFNNIKVTNVPQISGVAATQTEATAISSSIGIVIDIVSNGTGSLPTTIPYTTASTDPNVINAYNNLKANIPFIAAETVAYISSSWVTGSNSDTAFVYNDLSCSRDVALIVSGAAEDLLWNSNSASIQNGYYYYLYPSQATNTQLDETLDGISYASQLAQKIVLNTLFVTASASASAVYKALKNNKPFIQAETIAFVSSSWSELQYTESKCRRDVGLIIDAVATDILYGGNQRSATAGQYYFKYPSQATGSQIDSTLNAIDFAGGVAKNVITNVTFVTASQSVSASVELLRNNKGFIQNETMAWLDSAWSFFNYNKDKCKRDIGYIVDGIVTDLIYGGNERTVMSGEFYYKYPSKATLLGNGQSVGQLGQTIDGINYASRIAQKVTQNIVFHTASLEVSASADLLRKNKTFIAAETIAYVSSSWSTVYYNEASCSRDVNYLIDAAATDLYYGGQERSVTAGSYYFLFPSKATVAGVPSEANQLDPTITGVRYAGRLSSKVVLNPTFQYPSQSAIYGKELLAGNRKFLQKETIAFLSSSWSTLEYNEASCSRDVGFIVDAVSTDLIYGGNERSIQAGSYYYLIPSVAIQPSYTDNGKVGQKIQTADGVRYAKGVAGKVILQTQLIYPTVKKKQAAARLLASKETLKYSAIAYTNGAFPYLTYNEASCSRDTGLIVDACVTDLIYGGNERGIAAASSYYTGQYGSAKAVTKDQLLETLETNRYLRTRAEFIAANAPLEPFGSLIVATGIDYSYNGAGVTFKALPPNQGGTGVANPDYYITELGGGRIYFTSGDQNGNFSIGTGLTINQATGTLVGRTFNKSLFALVTPYSLALQI